jgi:hypothetical protein
MYVYAYESHRFHGYFDGDRKRRPQGAALDWGTQCSFLRNCGLTMWMQSPMQLLHPQFRRGTPIQSGSLRSSLSITIEVSVKPMRLVQKVVRVSCRKLGGNTTRFCVELNFLFARNHGQLLQRPKIAQWILNVW